MQLIAPDILQEARGLSVAAYAVGIVLGFFLWLLGWHGHRFWIVLFTTVIAGTIGLSSARAVGVQPFAAGLLLAIAAGMLALSLSRFLAFAAGGAAAWLLVRSTAPAWDEPLLSFLGGGLVGLLLFRAWTMALTSLGGTLVMAYSLLGLLDHFGKIDAVTWAERRPTLLNSICVVAALIGWLVQFSMERSRIALEKHKQEQDRLKHAQQELQKRLKAPGPRKWWQWSGQKKAA